MTQIWAHRGASAYAPENTLPAFALAEELGADGIELDVQLSADGEVVVIHDETLDRTTDAGGRIAELSLAEIRRADASGGAGERTPVPTLAEVLAAVRPGRMVVNVELKNLTEFYPGLERAALDVIAASGMADRVIVSSFNHWSLKTVQQLAPAMRVGLLLSDGIYLPWEYAADFGAAAIHPHWGFLRVPGLVDYAHAAGVAVHAWTVNAEADLVAVIGAGVDAVITNHPDVGLAVLRSLSR
ncbi:MAG: glycerophosphodiester phosphodiesterase family protein [Propionibacteriaceae bacterium]|nr:glycerophosphodiester phosphodiesterase family protein [Propionibacteriaceae bacterium]